MKPGTGRYEWIDLDGRLRKASHWDELPERMRNLIAFVPAAIPEPHTVEDHAVMATYNDRLQEAMRRCGPPTEADRETSRSR